MSDTNTPRFLEILSNKTKSTFIQALAQANSPVVLQAGALMQEKLIPLDAQKLVLMPCAGTGSTPGEEWELANYLILFQVDPETIKENLEKRGVLPKSFTHIHWHYSVAVFLNPMLNPQQTIQADPILTIGICSNKIKELMDTSNDANLSDKDLAHRLELRNNVDPFSLHIPQIYAFFNNGHKKLGEYKGSLAGEHVPHIRKMLLNLIALFTPIEGDAKLIGNSLSLKHKLLPNK